MPRPRRPVRIALFAVIGMLIGMLLAACGTESGPGRDPLTVYSGRSEQLIGPLLEKFTAATGIAVQARYGDSAELAAQLIEEGVNSPAQVFFAQDAGALGAVDEAGLFAVLPGPASDVIPAARLVTSDTPSTSAPAARAAMVSCTVDIPTRSAPRVRNIRISAGVS